MERFMARFLAVVLTMLSLVAVPMTGPADAQTSVAVDGKRKINLAGRQRMLSQRIAKAACFIAIDEDRDGHMTMLGDAHDLFDQTLADLRDGNTSLEMLAEINPGILEGLDIVARHWAKYSSTVGAILSEGSVSDDHLQAVAEVNIPTLVDMNRTVGLFEEKYGSSGDIHPALALAINVSGRQRMLSQKASKEFCLIAAGIEVEHNRSELARTVKLFEDSLNGLTDGDEGIGLPGAPNDEILAQLEKVRQIWMPLKAVFKKVADGANPTAEEIARVAADNNPLLVEMNKAVWMYDQL
jgi:hypothetical protein